MKLQAFMSITGRKNRKFKNGIILLIGLYIVIGSALYLFQEKLLFLPTQLEESYTFQFDLPFEELDFKPEEGVRLNALYFKSAQPKGVIFYSHGNAGDLSRWGEIASRFVKYNYDVLVWDYRSYGKSKGPRSEMAFYNDAEHIYDFLLTKYKPEEIVLYGRSLGTGISSYLASKRICQQLLLETPYYSIVDVAQYRFPIFPVEKLMTYKFPSYKYIPDVNVPVTIFHGTDDGVVPYKSAQKLAALKPYGIEFVTIKGGEHNNLVDFAGFHTALDKALK